MRSAPELVNPIPEQEIAAWARSMVATFLDDPYSASTARHNETLARVWEPARAWGVRDRGRWVATARTEARTMSVPGRGAGTAELRVDALTNVTVAATHRRRGLMTRMLAGSLRAARERGDSVSILIAAEWPIYGRLGYAPATLSADYVLHRSRRGGTCAGDLTRVRHVEREEFGEVASAVYATARRLRPGQLDRDPPWWDRMLGREGYQPADDLPLNWLLHEGDGGPDGLLVWKANDDVGLVPPLGTADVWNLTTASDDAYRDLWSYLSGIDLIDRVRVSNRPIDEPVRWLLGDARTLVMTQQVDFVWLRLLDVASALTARRYAVPGEVVLEVIDEHSDGWAAGRYRLQANGDDVQCERTGQDPDLEITQRALASIYLGGFRLRELMLSGAATERTPGALTHVDLMFSVPLPPWNATWF